MKRQQPTKRPGTEAESKNVSTKMLKSKAESSQDEKLTKKRGRISSGSSLVDKIFEVGLNFQSEDSDQVQISAQSMNSVTSISRRRITKLTGQTYIVGKIEDAQPVPQWLRKEYVIEGPALMAKVDVFTLILVGKFDKIFEEGKQVGVYIPPNSKTKQGLINPSQVDKMVIIRRFYQGKGQTVGTDMLSRPYIVLDPLNQLYPTYICNYVECKRKVTLQHYIQGNQVVNCCLVAGSACHHYLECLVKKEISPQSQEDQIKKVYNFFLYDMYLINYSYQKFVSYCDISLKNLKAFYLKYLIGLPKPHSSVPSIVVNPYAKSKEARKVIKITSMIGPEIMMKSQFFGMKGKVDLTLAGKLIVGEGTPQEIITDVIIPFQLKTGKRESDTHKRQVDIYMLLIREKYRSETIGILYYSETDKIIFREEQSEQGYISIVLVRNQIVQNQLKLYEDAETIKLPGYASNPANCVRYKRDNQQVELCEFAWECGVISDRNTFEDIEHPPKCSVKEIEQEIAKFTRTEADYFRKWISLLHLQQYQYRKNCVSLEKLGFNIFQINCQQLLKVKSNKEGRVRIIMYKKCKTFNQAEKVEGLFMGSEKIRFIISQIDLTEGAKIVSFRQKRKIVEVVVEMNNKQISFSEKKLSIMESIEQKALGQIQKFDNTTYGSMRNSVSEFIQKGQPWMKKLVIQQAKSTNPLENGSYIDAQKSTSKSIEQTVNPKQLQEMNADQKEAFQKAWAMQRYLLVEGMPGTGKTFLITRIAQYYYKKGLKVLITTYTNRSLDNIIERLIARKKLPQDSMIREGSRYSMPESLRHLSYRSRQFSSIEQYQQFFDSKAVWFVTMSSLFIHHIPKKFDIVIVDEASQCLQPLCLQALQKADRFILIGDSKQLQSVIKCQKARERGMGQSLFQKLLQKHPQNACSLKIQYRMCRAIMNLSNRLVYNGQLFIEDQKTQKQQLRMIGGWEKCIPACFKAVLDPSRPIVFLNLDQLPKFLKKDYKDTQKSKDIQEFRKIKNIVEVQLTCWIYRKLIQLGEEGTEQNLKKTAVICAYNSSVSSIMASLAKSKSFDTNDGYILTIDKSQGIDKESIVFLLQKATSGIVDNAKRLNVALTRAKSKLIIIASQHQLSIMKVHEGTLLEMLLPQRIDFTSEMLQEIIKTKMYDA